MVPVRARWERWERWERWAPHGPHEVLLLQTPSRGHSTNCRPWVSSIPNLIFLCESNSIKHGAFWVIYFLHQLYVLQYI